MPLIPAERRALALRAYGKTYDSVGWRAPSATRFHSVPANDHIRAEVTPSSAFGRTSWAVVIAGGIAAVLMGAILGGALAI